MSNPAGRWPGITQAQWDRMKWVLPKPRKRPFLRKHRRGGRPRACDKKIFEALLWVLKTDGPFERLPRRFGRRRTVLRRLSLWLITGLLHKLWSGYLQSLDEQERADWGRALNDRRLAGLWRNMLREQARSEYPNEFPRARAPSPG